MSSSSSIECWQSRCSRSKIRLPRRCSNSHENLWRRRSFCCLLSGRTHVNLLCNTYQKLKYIRMNNSLICMQNASGVAEIQVDHYHLDVRRSGRSRGIIDIHSSFNRLTSTDKVISLLVIPDDEHQVPQCL